MQSDSSERTEKSRKWHARHRYSIRTEGRRCDVKSDHVDDWVGRHQQSLIVILISSRCVLPEHCRNTHPVQWCMKRATGKTYLYFQWHFKYRRYDTFCTISRCNWQVIICAVIWFQGIFVLGELDVGSRRRPLMSFSAILCQISKKKTG